VLRKLNDDDDDDEHYLVGALRDGDSSVRDADGVHDALGGRVATSVRSVLVVGDLDFHGVRVRVDGADIQWRHLSGLASIDGKLCHGVHHHALRLQPRTRRLHLNNAP